MMDTTSSFPMNGAYGTSSIIPASIWFLNGVNTNGAAILIHTASRTESVGWVCTEKYSTSFLRREIEEMWSTIFVRTYNCSNVTSERPKTWEHSVFKKFRPAMVSMRPYFFMRRIGCILNVSPYSHENMYSFTLSSESFPIR